MKGIVGDDQVMVGVPFAAVNVTEVGAVADAYELPCEIVPETTQLPTASIVTKPVAETEQFAFEGV